MAVFQNDTALRKKLKALSQLFPIRKGKRFNIFSTMGIESRETIHSSIIAYLLNPASDHQIGYQFLHSFLQKMLDSPVACGDHLHKEAMETLISDTVRVETELDFMDIVLNFPKAKTAIAIENKIYHTERDNQLSDYQKRLPSIFPRSHYQNYYLIFLTPNGKYPETINAKDPNTNVIIMSYLDILNCLEQVRGSSQPDFQYFADQMIAHLKEDIVTDPNIKNECLKLYQSFPEACDAIAENPPNLAEFEGRISFLIEKKYGSTIVCSHHRIEGSGPVDQVFFRNDKWAVGSARIIYWLDWNSYKLKLFCCMKDSDAKKCAHQLASEFPKKETPKKLHPNWILWSISGDPIEIANQNDCFGDATAKVAFEKFQSLFNEVNTTLLKIKLK